MPLFGLLPPFLALILVSGSKGDRMNSGHSSISTTTIRPQLLATDEDEERLGIDMFRGYNPLIRPSPCRNSSVVHVDFGMAMILLISVDEKNQIMQSNVWLTLRWNDCRLTWKPSDYGGLESVHVPVDRVWVPDIVLFNNADGNYEVSYQSNVVVDHLGNVSWVPPAIYKSSCRIDVEYFPFDEQTCLLLFGSWTYSSDEVQLRWYNGKRFVELEDYSPSGIWDLMDVPGRMNADRSRIAFYIVIRRKTLFYTVILIIPTVLMASLSMLAFYLPAECSEKITLAISILLALVVFLLLVSKILPPTSDTIPLMAKYLLMTFILNIVTIVSTVAVINVYFRSAITHTMPRCVRQLFLHFLPILLAMKRPRQREMFRGTSVEEYQATANGETNEHEGMDTNLAMGPSALAATMLPFLGHVGTVAQQKRKSWREKSRRMRQRIRTADGRDEAEEEETDDVRAADDDASPASSSLRSLSRNTSPLPQLMRRSRTGANLTTKAAAEGARNGNRQICAKLTGLMDDQKMGKKLRLTIESIAFIAEHIKAEMSDKKVRDDWRFISMVIDRMLLLLFFGITLGGTIGIMFSVPHVFEFVDQQEILRRLTFPSDVEERLIADLFRGYNHLIRPVPNVSSTPLEIRFSLALTLLINVDEKNQIMQTNVWPTMRWIDYQMQWNPLEYGNIRTIRVPPDKVWLPDIVLFNNADGNYEVSFYSNVVVEHNGEMLWVPPAIYKSSCIIDVEFFPFDEQICAMIFGSWTFNKDEVIISYLNNKRQAELNDYSESGIWDIMEVPGQLIHQKSKIAYQIKIRRKTLFYTVILIIPTVLMAFLSMLVFYLPAEADEKITLAISILLALVVFLLLVSKILPPTSDTIPLIAKYLLMTFVMNIITILVTVIIINIYFRGPTTHTMPEWVRTVFLRYLPIFLMMNRPRNDPSESDEPPLLAISRKRSRMLRAKGSKKRQSVGRDSFGSFMANGDDGNELGAKNQRRQVKFMPGQFIEMSHSRREIRHHPRCAEYAAANEAVQRRAEQLRRRRMSQPVLTPARFPTHRDLGSDLSEMLTDEALQAN
ncbi:hypothetical protein niasHS_006545 [Heterodera schachtii]|uniref:Uncharacterized protein n=1 Tax=Heterodera schachtii TaxID=97005 RepID=A0ABD2JHJ9_HETSC